MGGASERVVVARSGFLYNALKLPSLHHQTREVGMAVVVEEHNVMCILNSLSQPSMGRHCKALVLPCSVRRRLGQGIEGAWEATSQGVMMTGCLCHVL